jgi:hypothetical protein
MADSGQTSVPIAGQTYSLLKTAPSSALSVKALIGNAGSVYIGNDGSGAVEDVSGFELAPGDMIIFDYVGGASTLLITADNNNDAVSWELVNV